MSFPLWRQSADRFLNGAGTYLPDIKISGLKHVAFARSKCAHGRILQVDIATARAMPGVHAVLTGADLAHRLCPMSHRLPTPPFQPLTWSLLATDKVRYIGDPIAVVVADDPYLAVDAAELVHATYEELASVEDAQMASAPDAPLLFEEWGTNIFASLDYEHGDVEARLRASAGVVHERFEHHRMCGFPLEGNGICAFVEPSGRLIVHASTQFASQLQTVLADITGMRLADIRVVVPDVGGGFGLKQHVVREELLVAALPLIVSCPVRWIRGLDETVENSIHARRQYHEVRAGYDADGRITALQLGILADVGDPVLYFSGVGPAIVTASSLPGAYAVPAYSYQVKAVATNTVPVGGFRGFGQPQALFTMERTLDLIARRIGKSPVDIRRINLIPDQPRPFLSPTGSAYDVGSVRAQFERAILAASELMETDRDGDAGVCSGIGFSCFVEPTAPDLHSFAGRWGAYEMVQVTMQADGHVVAAVGTKDIGQGSASAYARIIAEELTVDPAAVVIRDGDTDALPIGLGTLASRSLVLTGAALRDAARQLRTKLLAIAAHELMTPIESMTLREGSCRSDDGRGIMLREIAEIAYLFPFRLPEGVPPGLTSVGSFHARNADPFPSANGRINPGATYASQATVARVRVDPVSGTVHVTDIVVVYDCGNVVDRLAVQGQIQGSFAQGISAVLFEVQRYRDGRPAALDDYSVARMPDIPRVRAIAMGAPSTMPGGSRGVGQIGTIMAPAAIANAIDDALRAYGVVVRQSELTPSSIRRLCAPAANATK
ncbi:xanthine dehydrogenase family protein molybdopterin-binding subunit [Kribbella ginsengisoli]|uniref:Molybdopterin-dependent oxidoreductase n=1 Tax=Kribbella ginsengisoli TaxID=363865 RepID=A0ABP6Z7X1_9ACTN